MSARQPLFSVLIATFNQGAYIRETLDSVAAQTYGAYEIVIVDDGSTDATAEVVAAWEAGYRQRHPHRVAFSRTSNQGQSAALEHGLSLCAGEYICLLDSDDRWLPEKLHRVWQVVRENPEAGMIAHPLYVIDREGQRTGDVRPMRARLSHGDLRTQIRRTGRFVGTSTSGIVIKAEIFRQLVPMPTKAFRAHADHYLSFGAALLAQVCGLQEPLAEYRLHPEGNHLRALLSAEGLQYCVDLQTTVAQHFGLQEVLHRDSYFTRHDFARAKLQDDPVRQAVALWRLLRATLADPGFGFADRLLFSVFWLACLLSPPPLFRHLWYRFQLKATGYDQVLKGMAQAPPAPSARLASG